MELQPEFYAGFMIVGFIEDSRGKHISQTLRESLPIIAPSKVKVYADGVDIELDHFKGNHIYGYYTPHPSNPQMIGLMIRSIVFVTEVQLTTECRQNKVIHYSDN